MRKAIFIILATILLALGTFTQTAPVAAAPDAASDVVIEKDIVYGRADDVDLRLNLAKPPASTGPLPCIVYIHGGGWQAGNKDEVDYLLRELAAEGYVVASVGYRLTPKYPWPAQIEDVRCAVRYLRANADKLGIVPDKIGAMGHSAGAHLALMLGLMDATGPFDNSGGNSGPSSKVQAVANHYGPTDFRVWRLSSLGLVSIRQIFHKSFDELITDLVGTADHSAPIMKEVSPVAYIDAQDPPILTLHGDKDPIVPIPQAQLLHQELERARVPSKFITIKGSAHGFGGEKYTLAMKETVAFFNKNLKGVQP